MLLENGSGVACCFQFDYLGTSLVHPSLGWVSFLHFFEGKLYLSIDSVLGHWEALRRLT